MNERKKEWMKERKNERKKERKKKPTRWITARQWDVSLPENEILKRRFFSPLFLTQNDSTNSAAKIRKQGNYWANRFLDSACSYPTFPYVLESKAIKFNRCFDMKIAFSIKN
jgi:hypothetical protein